jgi:branched-chain amino acid transport system substrate-binding protein
MSKLHRVGTAFVGSALAAVLATGLAACGGSAATTGGCATPNGTSSLGSGVASVSGANHTPGFAQARVHLPTDTKALKLATFLPVSGTDASEGLPAQYGVDLAVSQNSDLGNGYTLTTQHFNYEGTSGPDTSIATTVATQMVGDSSIMAVAGPFNSGIAKVSMPITNGAGLVMMSMANTNPGLTKQQYSAANSIDYSALHPAGKPNAYFRVPGTDDVQGAVDAKIAFSNLGCKTAYVVDDNTVYGTGLANFFQTNYKTDGGSIVGSPQHITAAQVANLSSLASQIKSANPDVVFYGGVTSGGGGALKKALVAAGYKGPMVGGDGIADDSSFVTTAGGSAAVGTWGTVAAPDVSALTSSAATTFANNYKSTFAGKPNADLTPYAAMAYDCAMIEIQAIKAAVTAGTVTRDAVRTNVQSTNYTGITGQIKFDANGDNAGPKVFAVYAVDSTQKWVYKTQVNG